MPVQKSYTLPFQVVRYLVFSYINFYKRVVVVYSYILDSSIYIILVYSIVGLSISKYMDISGCRYVQQVFNEESIDKLIKTNKS